MLAEFKLDYNQRHFVRNETFAKAADSIQGPARKVCCILHPRHDSSGPQQNM